MFMKPFRGFRPAAHLSSQVASPPYDVINVEEARALAKDNDHSFLHVIKPEINFEPDGVPERAGLIEKARARLDAMCGEGLFQRDEQPAYYLYRQTWQGRSQTGLVGLAAVDDYDNDRIKKHEHTRQDKEDERTAHVHGTRAHTGPVFLAYRGASVIAELSERITQRPPDVDVEFQDVQHTLWLVSDEASCETMTQAVGSIEAFFVADGHHRTASASRNRALCKEANPNHQGDEDYNYFLTVIFPSEELDILPYHRVIKDLGGLSSAQIKERLGECFDHISDDAQPSEKMSIGVYMDGQWSQYRLKSHLLSADDPVASLDVAAVQTHVLENIFSINDPRTDKRIDFVGGIRGLPHLEQLVDSGQYAVAISMYPTHIDELFAVADAGEVMPPKSTWFEPKLLSGLVVNRF